MSDASESKGSAHELDERTRRLLQTIEELQEATRQSTAQLRQQTSTFEEGLQQLLIGENAKREAASRLGTRTPELERSLGNDVECLRCLRLIHEDLSINRDAEVILALYRAGLGTSVVEAMERYIDNDMIQHYACAIMAELAISGTVSKELVAAGAHSKVLVAMDTHRDCTQVQTHGVRFIGRCAQRGGNTEALVSSGAARRVYFAMDRLPDDPQVQTMGTAALERLVSGLSWPKSALAIVTVITMATAALVIPALMRQDVCGHEDDWTAFLGCAQDVLHNTAAACWGTRDPADL